MSATLPDILRWKRPIRPGNPCDSGIFTQRNGRIPLTGNAAFEIDSLSERQARITGPRGSRPVGLLSMEGEQPEETRIFVLDLRFPCNWQCKGLSGSPSNRRYQSNPSLDTTILTTKASITDSGTSCPSSMLVYCSRAYWRTVSFSV